ncbi:helix-turn-helix domain-containing protein [Neobacillus drentensis]|uniref:helix-turn-helix domain-containing protein n=1 Tax=Neobacillus drentensis TaxID=220684 RepID=UPI0030013844
MEQSKVISTAIKIYNITNLNTYVLDKNGEFLYHHEIISIPPFMPGSDDKDILFLFEKMKPKEQLYSFINEWNLHYFGFSFTQKMERYSIIIGPFFDKTPDFYSLSKNYLLTSSQSEDLKVTVDKIYVQTAEQASGYASILQQFTNMMEKDITPLLIISDKNNQHVHSKVNHINVDKEAELVKLRYMTERNFMNAVEKGDKKTALQLINSRNMLFSFSERFPNQPLRRMKNIAIILNTLLRTSARNSYVPAIMIHRISEKFAYEIENANQVETLHQLEDRMIEEYCDLVISNSLSKFSTMTQRVIEHLLSFYNKQINKEDLAAQLSIHPSHLSRKFKEETKITLTAFQQMLRIKEAKHLLKTENLSIEEIAWTIGYDDPSYFTRVFKKETGRTPSQYRDGAEV